MRPTHLRIAICAEEGLSSTCSSVYSKWPAHFKYQLIGPLDTMLWATFRVHLHFLVECWKRDFSDYCCLSYGGEKEVGYASNSIFGGSSHFSPPESHSGLSPMWSQFVSIWVLDLGSAIGSLKDWWKDKDCGSYCLCRDIQSILCLPNHFVKSPVPQDFLLCLSKASFDK